MTFTEMGILGEGKIRDGQQKFSWVRCEIQTFQWACEIGCWVVSLELKEVRTKYTNLGVVGCW